MYKLQIVYIKHSFCKTNEEAHLHIRMAPSGRRERKLKGENEQMSSGSEGKASNEGPAEDL